MQLGEIPGLILETFREPRETFRRILNLGLSIQEVWLALATVTAVTAFLFHITAMVAVRMDGNLAMGAVGPLLAGAIEFAGLALIGLLIFWGGRMFGGVGSLTDALLAVVWLQTVLDAIQVVQLVLMLILPVVSGLIGLASVGAMFWLITVFVAELHGFRSRFKTLIGIVLGLLGLGFALVPILALIGFGLPEMTNV